MIKHYILIAWRNLRRNKFLSVIQILCLSVGLVTFMLIFRYVQYEKNWDKFNVNFNRIYRVQLDWKDGRDFTYSQTPPALAHYFRENYPEVEKAIVMREVWEGFLSTSPERTYYEEQGYIAPNEIFEIFSFELLSGNKQNALVEPNSIVLSNSLAEKYFPGEDPMGRTVKDDQSSEYRVTGVMKDIPESSHITPSYFLSISSKSSLDLTVWDNQSFRTYLLLRQGVDYHQLNSRIINVIDEHVKANQFFVYLKPMKELHLNPNNINDFIVVIYFYSIIGLLILILASINFANLTTAFSISRAKEIGIRKVNGGGIKALQNQFLAESVLLAFISLVFALALARLILPYFNHVVQRNLPFDFFSNPLFFGIVVGSTLLTGLISGIYPAFLLSRFKPVAVLRGGNPVAKGKISGLKFLVTAQFVITVILLASTVWTYRQTQFLKTKQLGFNKSQLFHCMIPWNTGERKFEELRELAIKIPGVEDMSVSLTTPFHSNWARKVEKEGASADDWINFSYNEVSPEFISTYDLQLEEGRFFSRDLQSDQNACVINSEGARAFGWDSPLEQRLNIGGEWYHVIGVLKNFHINSVMWEIQPYVMKLHKGDLSGGCELTFKLSGISNQQATAELDNLLRSNFMNTLFTINHFDERANRGDVKIWESVGRTSAFFTVLAIIIAAVGLFGMVAHTTRKRVKEIGIRRVQGAKSYDIVLLVVKEFFFLLLIANLFVFPVPYLLVKTTPGTYKYQMNSWEFIVIIGMSLLIAIFASSYEALKAANMNPVKSLRYE
jgi:putative ABC transport system permease protein